MTGLNLQGNKWVVSTPQGRITADWVILATNGYTDSLYNGLSRSVLPLVSVQIATDPLEDKQISEILPDSHTISDTRRSIMYARREPVFGGHGRISSKNEIVGFETIVKDTIRIFPLLKGVNWRFRWGGRIAITEDRLPHFHEPKPGIIAGLGYNGRGVALSQVMGKCLAYRILDVPLKQLPYPCTALKGIPFSEMQMLGTGPVIGMMRLLERLESRRS